jgi:hypothetical protein
MPAAVSSRQLLLVVPVAAVLGITAALALYVVDRPSPKLPGFRVELAKQNDGLAVADHSPTSSAPRRFAELRRKRVAALRKQRALRARRAAARAAAIRAATPASVAELGQGTSVTTPGQSSAPASSPTPAPRPTPVARPEPKPTPKSSGGGGGGGSSFDDSG